MRNFWKGLLGILIVLLFNFEQVMAYNGGNNPAPGKPRANSRYVPYSPPESYPQILKRYNKQLIEVAGQIDPGLISKMQIKPEELVARTVFGGDFPVMEDGSFVVKVVEGVRQDVIFLSRKTGRLVLLGHFLPQDQFLWVDARSSLLSLTAILMPRVYPKLLSNWEALQKGGEILEEKLAEAHSLSELIRERVNTGLMVQGNKEIWPSEIELTVVSSDEVGGKVKLVNRVPGWFYADSGREERMLPRANLDVLKPLKDLIKNILKKFFHEDSQEEGDLFSEYGKIKLKVYRDSQNKAEVKVYNPLPLETMSPIVLIGSLLLGDYGKRLEKLSNDEKIKLNLAGLAHVVDMALSLILNLGLNSSEEEIKNLGEEVFNELKEGLGEEIIERTSRNLLQSFAPDNPVSDAIMHPDMVVNEIQNVAMDIGVNLLVDLIAKFLGIGLVVALLNFIATQLILIANAFFNKTFQYPKWTKSFVLLPPVETKPVVMILLDTSGSMSFSPVYFTTSYTTSMEKFLNGPFTLPNEVFPLEPSYKPSHYPVGAKIDQAKSVIIDLANSLKDFVRMGLMKLHPYNGGELVIGALDLSNESHYKTFVNKVRSMYADGATPIGEALADMVGYFQGRLGPPSPTKSPSELDIVIVVSDGQSVDDMTPQGWGVFGKDWDGDSHDPHSNPRCGEDECYIVEWDGSDYLDDVAYYLYHKGFYWNGSRKPVYVYSVGFTTSHALLEDTAINGGGDYYTANNVASLAYALKDLILQNLR